VAKRAGSVKSSPAATKPKPAAASTSGLGPIKKADLILIAGGGGFIGGHLIKSLLADGFTNIRAVDHRPIAKWWQRFPKQVEEIKADLKSEKACFDAAKGAKAIFNFACDMGGMGFVESNKALCMLSSLINTNLLQGAHKYGAKRYFFASSVVIYNTQAQVDPNRPPITETEAYPAMPDDGYGWEKLFGERMCRHFREDFGVQTRVVRYQPVYGPHGSWDDGRERVPLAICRKVAQAVVTGKHEIEIWGDGTQQRSFMYVDDCV
jgi:GDP-D-mannose 3', 5'-epimerase